MTFELILLGGYKLGIEKLIKSTSHVISKNSAALLNISAIGGLVSTVVLAVRATPKAYAIIDNTEYPLSKPEIIKQTWKLYVPALIVGSASIASIIFLNNLSTRKTAALATLLTLSETAAKEYSAKVVEMIGTKENIKIIDTIAKDKIEKNPVSENLVMLTGKGEVLCYDAMSGRYFKSDVEKIRQEVNNLNELLLSDDRVTLNEFYDAIGLPNIRLGDDMGWLVDRGLMEVTFSAQLSENNEPCLVLNYELTDQYFGRYPNS